MASAKEELIEYAYYKTLCQQRPECCEPRDIKMVMWDADDTMWNIEPYGIASNITGKLVKVNDDTVEVEEKYPPPKHAYPTVTPTKPPPPRKKKKRWWQEQVLQEKFPEWARGNLPGQSAEEELEEIEEELEESIKEEHKVPEGKQEKPVILDDISGWSQVQKNSVDNLLKRYGKRACKVYDVRDDGTIDIDCRGDLWALTKDGRLMGEQTVTPAPPALPPPKEETYKPRKVTITLLPTFRKTIDELKGKGIKSAIISLNSPGSVKRIVEAFGMLGDFVEVQDTWKNKGQVFDEIAKRNHICPCNAMFVDNTLNHVTDVAKKCGLALQIGKDKDVEKPIEIMRYIK
jgi:phosphoglycolate phosphatase-like HAD superfamily hydrolase